MWNIFHAAIALPAGERAALLDESCGGDAALRAEIEALLRSHERSDELPDAAAFLGGAAIEDELATASAGQMIGRYRIVREIGQGGMGAVYEAVQQPLDRRVALKLIRLGMDTRQVVARFEAERQTLAMMNHPNVARVIDAGATESGRPYFVMEYIDGTPITEYCDTHRLNTAQRLELFLAVCAGVEHAHQRGIIHRDLKPGNVLVTEENGRPVPKVIDFGIAKATARQSIEKTMFTQAGMLIGTPEYMSPEQAGLAEQDIDVRTDVYSLGVLLFELLVGALPFDPVELRRAGYEEIRRRIREEEPSRPSARLSTLQARSVELARNRNTDAQSLLRSLRGDLDWITIRALEKDRSRRYASAGEFAADLRRHISNEPVLASPPSVAYRAGKFARRHRLLVASGSVVTLAILVGLAAATWGLLRARAAERVATQEARTAEEVSGFLTGLFQVSEPSAEAANSITAREVLDRGVERIRAELAGEPAVRSRLMHEMGVVYSQLGLLDEAQQLLQEALQTREQLPDASVRDIAATRMALAGALHLASRHEEAITLYKSVIEQAGTGADADPLWLATAWRSLGGVYESMGRGEDSLAALGQARDLLQQAGLAQTAEYGRVLRNMGISYWSAEDFDKARAAYDEALQVYDQVLEPGHPEISYVVNSLAILNYNLGDFDAARPLFERELENLERTLGHEHQHTASLMNNLGLLLLEMGLVDEAAPKIEESLRIREKLLGPEHEDVATSLFNRAKLRLATGRPEQAVEDLRRCLAIREQVLGPDHPYVAGALEVLADALRRSGDEPAATAAELRAQQIRQQGTD
jgi:serine/threonine protein kinase/tetratricopeptide (TPR) repeat protein